MMTVAAPQNDPRLLAPTKCKVLRPLCIGGQRREVGDVVELPYHVAIECQYMGKARIIE